MNNNNNNNNNNNKLKYFSKRVQQRGRCSDQ